MNLPIVVFVTSMLALMPPASLSAAPGPALESASGSTELTFEVSLDDRPIGRHSFRIRESDGARVVESRATFDVSVLFIPVYSYLHQNTETWRNGCLQRIEAETDSNGRRYVVDGRRVEGGYRIETTDGPRRYAMDCLMTFAYWDPGMLSQRQLLNSQTGDLLPVSVEVLGSRNLEIGGRAVQADGYRVVAEGADVDLVVYYDRNNRWVGLESVLEGGRTMRYLPSADKRLAGLERAGQSSGREK